MTAPISPVSAVSPISSAAPAGATTGVDGASGSGSDFASVLGKGLDTVGQAQGNADSLSVQAATGQLVDPAALTVAMTQAQLMTQLMTTVQSKAVTSFNTIMGMQA